MCICQRYSVSHRIIEHFVDADEVIRGGSGYCIETVDGREIYHKERDHTLSEEVEHIYPDYDLYPELCKDTAYGFLTRGCPRGCNSAMLSKRGKMFPQSCGFI